MAYIGNNLQVAYPTYKVIDDISSSFNSSTTSFALLVSGAAPVPLPLNSQQCLISVGGVIQRPDDTGAEGFRLSGGNIVFSSAPATGADFFGVILAGADYVNVGANFPDGSAAVPSITFSDDSDTGFFRSSSGAVSFSSNAVSSAIFGANSFTAPSFIPTSSSVPNNGIFLPSANTVSISTNSTERFRINSSGNVGIGTTSPRSLLSFGVADTSGTNGINFYDNGGNYRTGIGGAVNYLRFYAPSDSGTIQFGTLSTANGSTFNEAARIDSSGRLLIGTSSARSNFNNTTDTTRLQVEGTDAATSSLSLVCNNGGGVPVASLHLAKSAGSSIGSNSAVGGNWVLGDIRFSGNDGTEFVQAASIACEVDATPGANDMPGRLVFSTTADGAASPTERMRITSDGYVGIGATARLGNGGIFFRNNVSAGAGEISFNRADTASTSFVIVFYNNGSLVGSITHTNAATAYNTSSDYRLKENIEPVNDGIARLQQLKPSRFNFIADPSKTVDGFIAHEVQAVVPEAITGEKDEVDDDGNPIYQGIDQSKLVPLLTAALQEAIAKIETLEARLSALESE